MKEKLKKFLFDVIEDGKIVCFTKTSLTLEYGDHEIKVTWELGDPESIEFKYKNLHQGTSTCVSYSTITTSSNVVISGATSRIYSITIDDLTYQVPMTIPESDNLTAILSEAFVVYQNTVLEKAFADFKVYLEEKEASPFDKILP